MNSARDRVAAILESLPFGADPYEMANAILEAGYVVIKEKSYRQAQERQRVAEALRAYADECRQGTERWAQSVCQEERRIRERLTFVYGVARAHGATVEELGGSSVPVGAGDPE